MDGFHPHSSFFGFLLLVLLQTSSEANPICSANSPVQIAENNEIGQVVATINLNPGVTVAFSPPPANPNNPFILNGNQLIVDRVLDYETSTSHVATIICTETATSLKVTLTIIVLVENLNDNSPTFAENPYRASVSELAPIGFPVGRYPATDKDLHPALYYTLKSDSNDFILRATTNPEILVNARLDYDKTSSVQLVLEAQDTPLTGRNSFTATTTIIVTILDGDNRPPWFLPCERKEINGALICQSSGYTGRVVQNELQAGVLPLKPGPLYAIDGDSGINEEITYSILSGNDQNLFEINPNTGNITMLKASDRLETIVLTVMAAQKLNTFQFATTTVSISVQQKSLQPPKFEKDQYEGLITSVGQMAVDSKNTPLQIIATDEDYTGTGGLNPYITYSLNNKDFSTVQGYIFMTKDLPEATYPIEMFATDTTTDETAQTLVLLEVKVGRTTTSTTVTQTTSPTEEPTSSSAGPSVSTDVSSQTANPTATTEESDSTSIIITSTSTSTSSSSTDNPAVRPSGEYKSSDMIALGVTLGVLLFVCLVVIGVLVHQMRKGKADWRKIYEASMFRSALGPGPGGQKEGIQYTNEAFQKDEDGGSTGSGAYEPVIAKASPQKADGPSTPAVVATLNALLPDNSSDASSDKADEEKEVKPILTKNRRMEEGYKSVWFKTDIDPNAREEVVIIPDTREDDSDMDDDEPPSSSSNRENDDKPVKTSKVGFADSDLDSGLGVRMEESEGDYEEVTSDL